MANIYKPVTADNISVVTNYINANIPVTGTLVSSSVGDNIKNYSHDMFQSVYDYNYTSSSANKLFDITVGLSEDSPLNNVNAIDIEKKISIYNQMCQVLAGYDENGVIQKLDEDGDYIASATKIEECYFFAFNRLLVKDKIKRGTFSISLYTGSNYPTIDGLTTFHDTHATSTYLVNSPAGEYSYLVTGSTKVGLVFYEAGVVVLTGSVFAGNLWTSRNASSTLSGTTITTCSDAVRHRIENIQFNNTTKVNSVTYFLNIGHRDFNYSSNKTFLDSSKIVTKTTPEELPTTYITSVGLYSADNELLAVGKLSEPKRKTPSESFVLKARINY
jgi:hypothetical protein